MTRRDPRRIAEHDLHRFTVDLLRIGARRGVIWAHVPNGELRDIRVAKKLKAMGVLPGFPDFIFILPHGIAAFLELKSHDGRLSADQSAFRDTCAAMDVPYFVARSSAEVEGVLRGLSVLKPANQRGQCRDHGVAASDRAGFTEGGTSGP